MRELRADNKSLRDRVDTLDKKIDAVEEDLSDKINAVERTLCDKISLLGDSVAGMRGMQKAMLWVMSGLGSLGIMGKILHWF